MSERVYLKDEFVLEATPTDLTNWLHHYMSYKHPSEDGGLWSSPYNGVISFHYQIPDCGHLIIQTEARTLGQLTVVEISYERQYEQYHAELIEQLQSRWVSRSNTELQGIWVIIHPEIVSVSKSRYDAGHLADSVEAAFKEVNTRVKEIVLEKAAKELDGTPLMNFAFSVNDPVLKLSPGTTDSDRNIQQGYMHIFAGSMIGIRNPKAHANLQIDDKKAIHLLYLASLLMYKVDEAIGNALSN